MSDHKARGKEQKSWIKTLRGIAFSIHGPNNEIDDLTDSEILEWDFYSDIEGLRTAKGFFQSLDKKHEKALAQERAKVWRECFKMGNKLVSVSQLAIICHVTPQAIRKAIRAGRIKAFKLGKQWVVNPNEANKINTREICSRR